MRLFALDGVSHLRTLNSASTGQDTNSTNARVKGRRIRDRKRRVEPQQTQIKYWTRQERLRIKYIQNHKQRCVSEDEIARIARNLSDLHLPFLAPTCDERDLSSENIMARLRWIIDTEGDFPREDDSGYQTHHDTPLAQHEKVATLEWTLPPNCSPSYPITEFVAHLRRVWQNETTLSLPTYWPIFVGVNWDDLLFRTISTDSVWSGQAMFDEKVTARVAEIKARNLKESESFSIGCTARDFHHVRLRRQWEMMTCMHSKMFGWTYQTKEQAHRRDNLKHAGRTDYNQHSPNQDIWPQTSISALLKLWEFVRNEESIEQESKPWFDELSSGWKLGRLIANIVSTDLFPAQRRPMTSWPTYLAQYGPPPVIDYACQATLGNIPLRKHSLMLFGVQYKRFDTKRAVETLAKAFQPMMTLFILYYLDTRTSLEEEMPWWMVLFGVLFDKEGVLIQSFYPVFNPHSHQSRSVDIGWGANSTTVTDYYNDTMRRPPYDRNRTLGIFYRIQGHCGFVFEQLSRWDGLQRAFERLEG